MSTNQPSQNVDQLKKLWDQPKKLLNRTPWKWIICISLFFVILFALKPYIFPGGWGVFPDELVTTTVEINPKGKTIKTVKTTQPIPGKTLWDWASLAGVPITLVIVGSSLQRLQQKRAEEFANQQRELAAELAEQQRKLAADETKEEVLQGYFDRLSALLVDKNLLAIAAKADIKPEEKDLLDSAVDVIWARTLSILQRFNDDKERKNSVIRFLIEPGYIDKLKLSLNSANLREAYLSGVNLKGVNLTKANLEGADLEGANLTKTNLTKANLTKANLTKANLEGADLEGANLTNADLVDVNFTNVGLISANLTNADLVDVNLTNAILEGADLTNANLCRANLRDADLTEANLTSAVLVSADLTDANLTSAVLVSANLTNADLTNADLTNADLTDAKLVPMRIKRAKNWQSAIYHGKRLDDPEVSQKLGLNDEV